MEQSIFTKIINGEIPCHKIYEDERTIAFLDIHPTQPGHTLVVPKTQIDHFDDLGDEDYMAVWRTVKKIAKAQDKVFGKARVGVKVMGFDVPHAHVHVLPMDTLDEYLSFTDMNQEPNHAELATIAQKLSAEVR